MVDHAPSLNVTGKRMGGCVLFNLSAFLLVVSCLISTCYGLEKEEPSAESVYQAGVVQILAYHDNALYNQGSGVVITRSGLVLTSAHLLADANKIVVQSHDGKSDLAVIANKNVERDIAVLRLELSLEPLELAINSPPDGDILTVVGYWQMTQEESDTSFFRMTKKPDFIAKRVPEVQQSKGLVESHNKEAGLLNLISTVGRGSYGAPVINRCGQVAGLVRPATGASLEELWQSHMPVGATVNDNRVLEQMLSAAGDQPVRADKACLSRVEEITQAEKSTQKKIIKEKAKLKRERAKVKEAEKKAKKAEKAAEDEKAVRAEVEKQRDEISSIAADTRRKVEKISSEKREKEERNELLMMAIYGSSVVFFLLVAGLLIKRRRDMQKAETALARASASFADCRFEGVDSGGAPVACIVLGRDLIQRESGLLLGRNPDLVQVVIADETVSRKHARLFVENDHLYVQDIGSTVGTKVNGQDIAGEETAIINGDSIEFGSVRLRLEIMREV